MVNATAIKPQIKEAPVLNGSRSILEFPPRNSEVPLQKRLVYVKEDLCWKSVISNDRE